MPAYTHDRYRMEKYMHWACKKCLVRPICNENCHRTKYKHYYCEPCDNACCSYPCPKVKKQLMYERVFEVYGDQMMEAWNKYMRETSLFGRLIRRPLESPVLHQPSKLTRKHRQFESDRPLHFLKGEV